jgi:hypothetical protein
MEERVAQKCERFIPTKVEAIELVHILDFFVSDFFRLIAGVKGEKMTVTRRSDGCLIGFDLPFWVEKAIKVNRINYAEAKEEKTISRSCFVQVETCCRAEFVVVQLDAGDSCVRV